MKKVIMIVLSALMLLSLAACSAPAAPSADADASGGADSSGTAAAGQELFGKVKSLVGNELKLDLAKTPDQGTIDSLTGGGGGEGAPGDISISRSDSATVEGGEGEAGGEGGGDAQVFAFNESTGESQVIYSSGEKQKMELEYTGESKDLAIPAGLPIKDMFGNELKPTELKEGNVLMVTLGDDGKPVSILVIE